MDIPLDLVQQRLAAALRYDGSEPDQAALGQCAADAANLVGAYIGNEVVPGPMAVHAASEVARELYTRLSAPGGVLSPYGDATPVRLARDPLKAAYPILAPVMGGGFA